MISDTDNEKIVISVIIPMYNAGEDIVPCVNSLISQSLKKRYQIIVVDDASTDDSVNILKGLTDNINNRACLFNIIDCKQNGRAGTARNIGIKSAVGEYIVFVDQDDVPDKDFLLKLYSGTQNDKIDCVTCDIKEVSGAVYKRADIKVTDGINQDQRDELMDHSGYVFAILVRRKVIIDNSLFFPEGFMFEDVLYPFGVYSHISSYNHLDEVLYYRNTSITSQTSSLDKKKMDNRIKSTEWYLDHFKDDRDVQQFFEKRVMCVAFYYIYSSCMWWMLTDSFFHPRLYDKSIFAECLRWIGNHTNLLNEGMYPFEGRYVRFALKMIYYCPVSFWVFRFITKSRDKILYINNKMLKSGKVGGR